MIKQVFQVQHYWEVIVFYSVDYGLFDVVEESLLDNGISRSALKELYFMMSSGRAKAVTFSNLRNHTSVVLFNPHQDKADYVDSIVHEAEHVKQAMLHAYKVEDTGEPPAYTIGYLIRRMYEVFSRLICGLGTA